MSGDVNIVLNVEPNDETVRAIGLRVNGETVQCQGISADADLASAGGQVTVRCLLQTAAVDGECVGMQMPPMYANGDYDIGAFITTDEDIERDATATQPVTLTNSGFVEIVHAAGETSGVVKGETFYGGPTDDDNTNLIHACPVAYDETVVGSLRLMAKQIETGDEEGTALDGAASFRTSGSASMGSAVRTRTDDEAPFTWTLLSDYNWWVEDVAGSTSATNTEHWFINDGPILDPDGRDVSDKFRVDNEHATSKDALWFDFRAPRLNVGDAASTVYLRYHPSGGWNTASIDDGNYISAGSSAHLWVSNAEERGVGGFDPTIAVGDCTVSANTDNRSSTAFVPGDGMEDVRNVADLPEDDADDGPSDDGGLNCYVAELQALVDGFGNATNVGSSAIDRVHTGRFGVDKTAPEVDRLNPDEEVVLNASMVTFNAEDPELETGEEGSGIGRVSGYRYCAGSWWDCPIPAAVTEGDGSITVGGLDDGSYDVRALVRDNATPANTSVPSYSFTLDTKAPTFNLGGSPGGQISAGSSSSITVVVSGTIRDANPIEEALLTVMTNGGSTDICGGDDAYHATNNPTGDRPLPRSRARQYDLENDTKTIEFSQSVTIGRAAGGGMENLCFNLELTDSAVGHEGDDNGNMSVYSAGNFSVNWGLGVNVTEDELSVPEGGSATYDVSLQSAPVGDVTVTPRASNSHVTFDPATLTFTTSDFGTAQTVTVSAAEDTDAANEATTISHSASGGGYGNVSIASVAVTQADNDATLAVDVNSIDEGAIDTVEVTVELATAATADVAVTLTLVGNVPDDSDNEQPDIRTIDSEGNLSAPITWDAASGGTVTLTIAGTTAVPAKKGTVMLEIEVGELDGTRDRRLRVTGAFSHISGTNVTAPERVDITLVNDDS